MIPINHVGKRKLKKTPKNPIGVHWSLYVVINPGKVLISNMTDNEEEDAMVTPAFCLFMDSYNWTNDCHDNILYYLNEEAKNKKNLSNNPFNNESLPCYVPEGK